MSQAVKNERLAVRQKLVNVYGDKALEVRNEVDKRWKYQEEMVARTLREERFPDFFVHLIGNRASADGVVVYDGNGECIYPTRAPEMSEETELAEEFEGAWEVEFSQNDLESAMKWYEEIADKSESAYCYYKALLGQVRCLRGLGEIEKAIDVCEHIAYKSTQKKKDKRGLFLRANAKLLLAELRKEIRNRDGDSEWKFQAAVRNLLNMAGNYNSSSGILLGISSEQRVFLGRKAFELIEESGPFLPHPDYNDIPEAIARISDINRKLVAAEELSLQVASKHINPRGGLLRVYEKLPGAGSSVYYFNCKADDKTVMLLRQRENFIHEPKVAREKGMIYDLKYYTEAFENSDVAYRIVDRWDAYIGGVRTPKGEPLLSTSVGANFPGWKLELYLKDNGSFEEAARRQTAVYIWSGVLVIVLILASGGIAGQAVGRQIKLNRLKNDFIATVSHELKTPLASMRVLVDTLLEGRYKGQEQATEYLELVSKENERLSRLIDNFLTFSRMERNKQAFEIVKTSPTAIARTAAEVVKTKFSEGRCKFKVNICENLPDVLADRDAIVTVLANLLDNAYKYSYDDKHIELRVFTEDGLVCFSVADDGVGMSRRTTTKIFKRFYQVDRSLSRRTQGCGLGLSIAKFIIDAHKGSISVDSKPGTGSTFTVKLPAVN
jgi:signal transduction histidine kinase